MSLAAYPLKETVMNYQRLKHKKLKTDTTLQNCHKHPHGISGPSLCPSVTRPAPVLPTLSRSGVRECPSSQVQYRQVTEKAVMQKVGKQGGEGGGKQRGEERKHLLQILVNPENSSHTSDNHLTSALFLTSLHLFHAFYASSVTVFPPFVTLTAIAPNNNKKNVT